MSRSVATYKNVLLAFIAAASLYRCPELQSQSIFTVAGGGIDDGGPALGAALHPEAVAQDAAGNLYIADKGHSRIRKVSAVTGLISTFAGNGFWGYSGDGGLATAAAVNQPSDVRFDRDGNLYVSDWANYRIRKIAAGTGVITTVAGGGSLLGDGGPATAAALHEPNSLDIDDAGNIYFVDRLNYRIRKIDKNTGIITTIAGNGTNSFAGDGGLAVAASLYLPDRLAVDPEGSIYFSEFRRVRKIDGRTGLITTFAGGGFGVGDGEPATATALGTPHGVAVGPDGDIFIGTEHDVRRVARNTGVISTVVTGGYFYGIRFGPSGKLYAATMENYVFEIDPVAKTKLKVAGGGSDLKGDGGPALRATLSQPSGMAADGGGNLYIADTNNGAVRRVDGQTGVISTLLRVNALSPARPYSVAVDVANGDIYAGSGYGIIRFDSKTLTASTIVDSADRCVLGDGGPASLATTRPASGLAVDTSGDLLLRGDQRVREISLRSGLISTVAGNGSSTFTGENGPATAAYLRGGVGGERGVALDTSGNIYVTADSAVRRVAAQTGRITTVAGTGKSNYCTPERGRREDPRQIIMSPTDLALDRSGDLLIATSRGIYRLLENENVAEVVAGGGSAYPGDGGPATSSDVTASGIALDAAGNLFLTDRYALRRVDTGTGIITTVAGKMGTMGFAGDGGPATAALFSSPSGIAVDRSGNVFVADSTNYRVRKIDAETGVIRTVAGNGTRGTTGDGGPATQAMLDYPTSVLVDSSGNLFIAAERVRRVAAATGVISTVPGTEGLSVSALAFDGASGLLVAGGGQVSRVSLDTGNVTTVAGTRTQGGWDQFEGSPATSIPLGSDGNSLGVATDSSGSLYFAAQGRVLKASAGSRTITTVAGGKTGFSGDGGPANQAGLSSPVGVAVDSSGNVYVADSRNKRIRRVDARSGTISTFAGGGTGVGDGGRATDAELGKPVGVNVGPSGTVYIADAVSSLIRAVNPCQSSLGAFDGSYPGDGSLVSSGTLGINWARAESAFRYDVVLDTDFPPKVVVQRDVSGQGLQVAGLAPGKTYYWQVRAKGDPYCPAVERTSGVRRFTVPMPCLPPAAPVLASPQKPGTNTTLTFAGVPGASSYDVYLGTGVTPPVVASGVTGSTYAASGLQPGTTYRWRVMAHASCNTELTTSSLEGTFTVSGGCGAPQSAVLSSPAGGTTSLGQETTLLWQPVTGAGSYDVYLGTGSEPSLLATEVTGTSLEVSLQPGKTYRWKVVARSACDGTKTSSSNVSSFTTATACATPAVPSGLSSTKSTAYLGSSYTLTWEAVEGASSYTVERSKSGDFSSAEVTTAGQPEVVLTATDKTTYFHRVRAKTSCGTESGRSPVLQTNVSAAPPHIEMLGPPRATVVAQQAAGVPLPRLEVLVQNTGTTDFVGFFNTAQTIPFFIPSETFISLRAGEIRIFYLQLSGVPTDRAGVYEGILALQSSDPTDTTAYPQAYISLNITGQKSTDPIPTTTAPQILDEKGQPIDMLRFAAPTTQNPVSEATIRVRNTGNVPLDLGADFLPDPWVSIESADSSSTAWNATPIPPGASRDVKLKVQRIRGESGGAFPRYTYLTLRTIDGKSSRLLLQDSETIPAGPCAGRPVLTPEESSLIVPSVVNARGKNNELYVSKALITNLGPDAAQVELFYTPDTGEPATSGYDCTKVLQATLIAPGLDVLSISDVLGQVFQTTGSGSLEIRSSRIGQLRVQSVVDAPASGGGSFGFQLPVVRSGEGARPGKPYSVIGVVQNGTYRTNVILTETSGQAASVTVTLYDTTGKEIGWMERVLGPYGKTQVSLSELAGGRELTGGAVEIEANSGSAGSVIGVTTVIDNQTSDASSFVARPVKPETRSTSYSVLSVVYTTTFQSRLEIRNNDTKAVTYRITYRGNTGTVESEPRTLEPRQEDAWENVLRDLLKLPPGGYGPLTITSDSAALQVVSRVYAETAAGTYGDAIEGIPTDDATTTGESNRILIVDGLEGTSDGDRTRGARTNLIMTEIAGGKVTVELSLWEKSQRRIAPLARKTYSFEANQQIQLNDVFAALYAGQKDRTNAMAMLKPLPGSTGRVVALATRIDNKTNDTKNLAMKP